MPLGPHLRGESDHATSQAVAGKEGTLPDKDAERFGVERRYPKMSRYVADGKRSSVTEISHYFQRVEQMSR